MDENWLFCCCFQNVQLVFRYFLAVPRYQKLRKTRCFAAIFKLFALLFSNCDEFQIFFEKFLKIFWKKPKISENFSNPVIFCCQPFKNGWKLVVSLLFSIFSASFSLLLAVPRWKTKCFAAIFKLFAFLFSNFDEFRKMFRNELIKKKWKKLKKNIFSEKLWLQRFSAASQNEWKLAVLLLFSKCSASFSLLFGSSQVPKVAEN